MTTQRSFSSAPETQLSPPRLTHTPPPPPLPPPAASTTLIASCVEPPVVQTSSTTNTCVSGLSENPLRRHIVPLPSRSTNIAGTPPPSASPCAGSARATSCPIITPPTAREPTASILASENKAASACPSFSANRGYCKTSAHCT